MNYYLVNITVPGGGGGLTYSSTEPLQPGQLVIVSLRRRLVVAVVRQAVAAPDFSTKPVERIIATPPLPPTLLQLADWISQYYCCDLGTVWQTLLPSGVQRQRRTVATKVTPEPKPNKLTLTSEQQQAVSAVTSSESTTTLLEGITGSGKTEVYITLAAEQIKKGRSVIVLVPEIALTPQIEERFRHYFGQSVLINHSRLAEAERHLIWQQALTSTEPLIIIGPRSSLFTPLAQLGLIVVDECHETSFKQENAPRYEASVVAGKLAHLSAAKLVLGSATPGLREAYLAKAGRIGLVQLTKRYNQLDPPRPQIVDLRDRQLFDTNRFLSRPLIQALDHSISERRQSLLFLNRRGSASSRLCSHCGQVSLCPNCHLPLTFHADALRLICHICNYQIAPPAVCPNCGRAELRFLGSGTKRIETEVTALFPNARVARLDRDNLTLDYVQELYAKLSAGTVDILVGTQMIAKGLDLPAMDTVGVVLADSSLYLPDFSAGERTFDLLSQVSGRAGRGDRAGTVIFQTYSPNHPAIQAAARGNFWEFAQAELAERRLLAYPPYVYLLKLTYSHKDEAKAKSAAQALLAKLASNRDIQLTGPAPAYRAHAGGRFHWQLIARSARRRNLVAAAGQVPSGWAVDLDPINLL